MRSSATSATRRRCWRRPRCARVHPLGKSPVIEDRAGGSIAETGAIVEYLVEKAEGRLGPPANRDSVLRYRHFLHYAEGSMMPPLLALLVVNRLGVLGKPGEEADARDVPPPSRLAGKRARRRATGSRARNSPPPTS